MPRKRYQPTPAEIIAYQKLKTAAGGSGSSGGGTTSGDKIISLMASLVRQRQSNLPDASSSNKESNGPESET
ncbi:MAG: hypothetical protein KGS72_13565 [Cyanobacteria bacterium REEB67]|nr:hypothetical protein [Cyanobacteria bacterium REEB67]